MSLFEDNRIWHAGTVPRTVQGALGIIPANAATKKAKQCVPEKTAVAAYVQGPNVGVSWVSMANYIRGKWPGRITAAPVAPRGINQAPGMFLVALQRPFILENGRTLGRPRSIPSTRECSRHATRPPAPGRAT